MADGSEGGSGNIFDIPISITQTPISGIDGDVHASTGSFFGSDNAQPPSPQDLISANVGSSNVGGIILLIGAALTALVIYRKVK